MNIRFRGVEEVLQNWNSASKAILDAENLQYEQNIAFAPIPHYEQQMGYLHGQADAFIQAAANDPDFTVAPQAYTHFQTAYPAQDEIGQTWTTHASALPTPYRHDALKKFEAALTTISTKLGKPVPTPLVEAIKSLLP